MGVILDLLVVGWGLLLIIMVGRGFGGGVSFFVMVSKVGCGGLINLGVGVVLGWIIG